MTSKPAYFAYVRVSTQRQGEQGSSLTAQRRSIEHFAAQHDLTISDWIEETVTAAKAGRPLFAQMLAQLRKGHATGVVIHKIDRSARNLKDWAALGELIDAGIDVRFVADSVDLSSRSGRLSPDIQAVVAADYVRNLKEEARKGFYGRLNQGLYPLGASLGYLNNGRGKVKTWCSETAPLVRRAFELYATGQFSLQQLSIECYTRGLRNRTGHVVSRNALARILRNRFYCGQMVLGKNDEVFAGLHAPLIPDELFRRVDSILNGRMKRKVKSPSLVYRKLLRCASCRNHLIGELQKGYIYYRCHTKDCPMKCVRSEIIDRQVQEKLPLFQPTCTEQELRQAMKQLRHTWVNESHSDHRRTKLLSGKLKRRLETLMDGFLDGKTKEEATAALGARHENCSLIVDALARDGLLVADDNRYRAAEIAEAVLEKKFKDIGAEFDVLGSTFAWMGFAIQFQVDFKYLDSQGMKALEWIQCRQIWGFRLAIFGIILTIIFGIVGFFLT